jgi:hypothetical protein
MMHSDEFFINVVSFNPDSILILPVLSRVLREMSKIAQMYATEHVSFILYNGLANGSRLCRAIIDRTDLRFSANQGVRIQFMMSIPGIIRSFGISREVCPDRILSHEEIHRFGLLIESSPEEKTRRIVAFCMHREMIHPLCRAIYKMYIQKMPNQPESCVAFLMSIPAIIRSFGISQDACPDRMLSLEEIQQFVSKIDHSGRIKRAGGI